MTIIAQSRMQYNYKRSKFLHAIEIILVQIQTTFYKLFNYSQGPKDSSVSLLHRQNKTGLGIFLKSHFSFLP